MERSIILYVCILSQKEAYNIEVGVGGNQYNEQNDSEIKNLKPLIV